VHRAASLFCHGSRHPRHAHAKLSPPVVGTAVLRRTSVWVRMDRAGTMIAMSTIQTVAAYAAPAAKAPLERTTIERRAVGEYDVLIDIKYAGICHSDIHQAREGWGEAIFPMVPGHEIAGVV